MGTCLISNMGTSFISAIRRGYGGCRDEMRNVPISSED
jgi:hypothetical protein